MSGPAASLLALEIEGVWEGSTESKERPQSAGCPSDLPLKSPEQSCRGMSPAEGTPSPFFLEQATVQQLVLSRFWTLAGEK